MGKNSDDDIETKIKAGLAETERLITCPAIFEMLLRAKASRSLPKIHLDAAAGKLRMVKLGNMQVTVPEEALRYVAACVAEKKPREPTSSTAKRMADRLEREMQL